MMVRKAEGPLAHSGSGCLPTASATQNSPGTHHSASSLTSLWGPRQLAQSPSILERPATPSPNWEIRPSRQPGPY
jgi:hypothetical protein